VFNSQVSAGAKGKQIRSVNGNTRIHARSKSPIGQGDFGQNRRNLLAISGVSRAHAHQRLNGFTANPHTTAF
jgi:hypothetical protein